MGSAVSAPEVAIAAGGAVTALGLGVEKIAEAVRTNSTGLRECPRLAGKGYQSTVAGFVPDAVWRHLQERDPAHADAPAFLLAGAALHEALEGLRWKEARSAGLRPGPDAHQPSFAPGCKPSLRQPQKDLFASIPPARRGLVLSTTKAEIGVLERTARQETCSAPVQRHLFPALLAADLASAHDLAGPVQCVSAACISGVLAIQQGAILILEDKADVVLVVGVDLLSDFVLCGFTTLKSLETNGCRPFDLERKGLSLGEGAGALALARRDALPGPAIVVSGWGSSNDANHLTGPSRDGSGLALAMNRALHAAGIAPAAIDFVHAHGTGTPFNDAMEGMALRLVFGERVPPFCSSKGLLGHTLGAAGVLETLVCLTAARQQLLPGTPGLRTPDPAVPDSVLQVPRPAKSLRHMLKVNAGFGGTNAALALTWEAA